MPESEIKAFIARLAGPPGGAQTAELLAMAKESLDLGDLAGAAQAFAQVLREDPQNPSAIAGMARIYLTNGDAERAAEFLALAAPDAKSAELDSVRAALALAAKGDAETGGLEARLAADPDDHQARFDLAGVLAARGDFEAAADHLLHIVARDRTWNDDGARKQLLTVFEAAGQMSEVAKQGRKRLSTILFS